MSVDQWKKMRRKQQEVVLTVWENVLETMKFRAAEKGDFGTSLDGLYGPKTTPFDVALNALKELCGTPKFFNSCPGCVFLGNYFSGPPSMERAATKEESGPKDTWYDLYYCNQGHGVGKHMLTARFGDAPKPGDTYSEGQALSGAFDPNSIVGQDLSYIVAKPNECKHPVLKIARDEAVMRSLIPIDDVFPDSEKFSI
jgi:hypothetical protein